MNEHLISKKSMDSVWGLDFLNWSPLEGMDQYLLPAESVTVQVDDVILVNTNVKGALLITNFRLLFVNKATSQLNPLGTIPLATIDEFSKKEARANYAAKYQSTASRLLRVVGKDIRILVYAFPSQSKQREEIFGELTRRLRASRLCDLYAFNCKRYMVRNRNPNKRLHQEYLRLLGKGNLNHEGSRKSNKWWRISKVNSNYTVCPTYPSLLIVPRNISDWDVLQAAGLRARGRLPVITWCHPENGAVLARSSQPLFRMINIIRRSTSDEKLVAALSASGKSSSIDTELMYIVDARPITNALANIAKGGGSESSSSYSQAKVVFLGIDNIHAMRDSFSKLRDYMDTHGSSSSYGSSSLLRNGDWNWRGGNDSVSAYENSRWVRHIHTVLVGSAWIAGQIALQGASVLVHCSDGWDRTTQLVSLAGILLDPCYRTFEGFQAVVEKDWLAFGHPFADRLGMPRSNDALAISSNNSSPIFLQWVDCVAQILAMYPCAFEFSSAYLVEILDCVLSGRFGNFLCNTEKERQEVGVADSCGCMWVYLTELRKSSGRSYIHEHCNIFYSPEEHPGPLLPPAAALAPTLWSRFHLRWTSPLEARRGSEIESQCRVTERNLMEFQKTKENAEKNLKAIPTKLESLTRQPVSEKSASRKARREKMATKPTMESVGCKVNLSGSYYSFHTDIASSEDLEEKTVGISRKDLPEIKDVDEVKEQKKEDKFVSISVSLESDLDESLIREGRDSKRFKSTGDGFSGSTKLFRIIPSYFK